MIKLTTQAFGSTRCPWCEKKFAATPDMPTVDIETIDRARNRYGGLSGPCREFAVLQRWHHECLTAAFPSQHHPILPAASAPRRMVSPDATA